MYSHKRKRFELRNTRMNAAAEEIGEFPAGIGLETCPDGLGESLDGALAASGHDRRRLGPPSDSRDPMAARSALAVSGGVPGELSGMRGRPGPSVQARGRGAAGLIVMSRSEARAPRWTFVQTACTDGSAALAPPDFPVEPRGWVSGPAAGTASELDNLWQALWMSDNRRQGNVVELCIRKEAESRREKIGVTKNTRRKVVPITTLSSRAE